MNVNKKQNKIAKISIFFFDRQLVVYKQNLREVLYVNKNDFNDNDYEYEINLNYNANVARLFIKKIYIDNMLTNDFKI